MAVKIMSMKLKEFIISEAEDFDKIVKTGPKGIYLAGKNWKQFDYKKGLDALIKTGNAYFMYYAGVYWEQFDYEKGLDALIKLGDAYSIYDAGANWKKFNYEKGLDALIKTGKAEYIHDAGVYWKEFDYKKALSFLKKNSKIHYEMALKNWPKGVKQSKAEIERLKKDSKELPAKRLKLKEFVIKEVARVKPFSADEKRVYKALKYATGRSSSMESLIDELVPLMDEGIDVRNIIGKSSVCARLAGFLAKQGFVKSFYILKDKKRILKALPKGVEQSKAEIERLKKDSKELPTKRLKL